MSKFDKKRMTMLIGEKNSVCSTDAQESTSPHFLTQNKHNRPKLNKSTLFKQYTYINLNSKQGNTTSKVPFRCFKDNLIFQQNLPMKTLACDNDIESDEQQIRQCKKRMTQWLRSEVSYHKYDSNNN